MGALDKPLAAGQETVIRHGVMILIGIALRQVGDCLSDILTWRSRA